MQTTADHGDWVQEAVRVSEELFLFEPDAMPPAPTAADFGERCKAAAEAAVGIATLRSEKARLGFIPIPIGEYLGELSKPMRIDLRPVLAAAGVSREGATLAPTRELARLCKWLGFSFRETFLHFGMALAERVGAASISPVMTRRGGSLAVADPLEGYETLLRLTLGERQALGRLEALERELRSVFAEPADDID
jgi:hypothetical protein